MLRYECEYQKTHPDYVPFSVPDEYYDGTDAGSPEYVASAYVDALGAGLGSWGVVAGLAMLALGASAAPAVLACGAAVSAVGWGRLVYRGVRDFR